MAEDFSIRQISNSLFFIILIYCFKEGDGRCYFPGELQGVWATQAAPDVTTAPIIYTMVNISASYISTWGACHRKVDDNIILAEKSRYRASPCYRCFRLVVASVNVAALLSSGLESCFLTEEAALASCPTSEGISIHISLYKLQSEWQQMQCPLSGVYHFSYYKGERGTGSRRGSRSHRCEQPTSEMSNCPFGYSLRLQYSDCTFERPRVAEWYCLGSWKGLNGELYTAVGDVDAREGDGNPKFKCGIFRHDKSNGRVYLSFSRDSTCTNDLFSAEDGNERYILNEVPRPPLPNEAHKHFCHFPSGLRGSWHNLEVRRSMITFSDEVNYETLHMKCLKEDRIKGKFAVYVRNNCRKSFYSCLLLKRRSHNILEIMIGMKEKRDHPNICSDAHFMRANSSWFTLAKTEREMPASCPIVGTYQGGLPDAPGYCAELYSDCSHTNIMYYAVDECPNPESVYEQREYECLGDWEEDGRIFALTRRRDIHTYECFEGIEGADGIITIKEAGSSCRRGIELKAFGMQTVMKAGCPKIKRVVNESGLSRASSSRARDFTPTRPPWVPSTTHAWKLITDRPRRSSAAAIRPKWNEPSLLIIALVISAAKFS